MTDHTPRPVQDFPHPYSMSEFTAFVRALAPPDHAVARLVATAAAFFEERERCSGVAFAQHERCTTAGDVPGAVAAAAIADRIRNPDQLTFGVDMVPMASNNVASVGYDTQRQRLIVLFRSGGAYEYIDVPKAVFENLLKAKSVGGYINTAVKPFFGAEKLDPDRVGGGLRGLPRGKPVIFLCGGSGVNQIAAAVDETAPAGPVFVGTVPSIAVPRIGDYIRSADGTYNEVMSLLRLDDDVVSDIGSRRRGFSVACIPIGTSALDSVSKRISGLWVVPVAGAK